MKHPLQPDYAKFNQNKDFCTAVGYKPLMWPLSDWKFLFTSNTLKICSSFQRRIFIFQGFRFLQFRLYAAIKEKGVMSRMHLAYVIK